MKHAEQIHAKYLKFCAAGSIPSLPNEGFYNNVQEITLGGGKILTSMRYVPGVPVKNQVSTRPPKTQSREMPVM